MDEVEAAKQRSALVRQDPKAREGTPKDHAATAGDEVPAQPGRAAEREGEEQ